MKHYYSLLLGVVAAGHLGAQTTIGAASGKAQINNQSHEWSVGEMCAVSTISSPTLIVTQGFFQPFIGTVATDEALLVFADFQVSPNPTAAMATLTGFFPEGEKTAALLLVDAKGGVIDNRTLQGEPKAPIQYEMDLTALPSGTYFLNIQLSTATKTFSIIKL